MPVKKVGVYGPPYSSPSDSAIIEKAREIGREIATRKLILVTGASMGWPYEAVLAARDKGGSCIGYSPARDMQEHGGWGFPAEGFSDLIFIRADYEHIGDKSVCLNYRNISSIAAVDAGIIIGGGMDTLNEFLLLYDMNKDTGILEFSGGVTGFITENGEIGFGVIRDLLDNERRTFWSKPRVVFERKPVDLVKRLLGE